MAVMDAIATGIKLRGFHSKRRSSTAKRIAASGVAKTADIPAAAPATSKVFRSFADRWMPCPSNDPNAPAVMMIGPSAPNGPPVPMDNADDSGFKNATLGSIRLWPNKIASNASGMPWPRIFSDPNRAIKPIINAPTTGTITTNSPR